MNPTCKFSLLILIIAISASYPGYASQNDEDALQSNYLGYTRSAKGGLASRHYIDLSSVRWVDHVIRFDALSHILQGGYLIFNASTDCKNWFFREDGTQYNSDGTFAENVTGDNDLRSLVESAEMQPIVKLACHQAQQKRVIIGGFDNGKALELLYGNYDAAKNASLWQEIISSEGSIKQLVSVLISKSLRKESLKSTY